MNKGIIDIGHHQTFESLRREAESSEFWSARRLSKVLEYSKYHRFQPIMEKAKEACKSTGHPIFDHFVDFTEMVDEST
jgi:DNA-damage-inducible protein D